MKKLNYTGSSKLKSRIAYLLNRKAPLPLDGNDDPDWGTNGQVLSTDGNGNTAWVNQGGGGSGGHTIWNRIKSALTQRGKLWFADASVSDASADDATKVEVVTELASETAFDNLPTDGTADGIYAFPDSGGEYLTAAMSSYDNTASGLSSSNVQDAIDEICTDYKKGRISLNGVWSSTPWYGRYFALIPYRNADKATIVIDGVNSLANQTLISTTAYIENQKADYFTIYSDNAGIGGTAFAMDITVS